MKHVLTASLFIAVALPSLSWACDGHEEAQTTINTLSVEQVAGLLPEKKISPIDANGSQTREKYGTLPGAILLSSASQYDAAKELPKDKAQKLVFYCASTQCSSTKTAAKRAVQAGYSVTVRRAPSKQRARLQHPSLQPIPQAGVAARR